MMPWPYRVINYDLNHLISAPSHPPQNSNRPTLSHCPTPTSDSGGIIITRTRPHLHHDFPRHGCLRPRIAFALLTTTSPLQITKPTVTISYTALIQLILPHQPASAPYYKHRRRCEKYQNTRGSSPRAAVRPSCTRALLGISNCHLVNHH